MMTAVLLAGALGFGGMPPAAAHEFTCDQVRWAIRTFPRSTIRAYARLASAADLARARRCLHPFSRRSTRVTP
jgi:hypothetical protein